MIGLINNMPDGALEATESQFSTLLAAAAGERDVRLRFSYLPEVPRGPDALKYLQEVYWPLETLKSDPPDALIVTGAEPVALQLSQEPYWGRLTALLDWADLHTISSIWSCLAAHAAVQHISGIVRRRLPEKFCGIYEHSVDVQHPMGMRLTDPFRTPHSRWNDLAVEELLQAGYSIASHSCVTGANVFTLQRRSFLVFLQGHPEYDAYTLLREYRRDVTRFITGSQLSYPNLPEGYLSDAAKLRLAAFKEQAIVQNTAELAAHFPFEAEARELEHTWKDASIALYENWLSYIVETLGGRQRRATTS